jgi:hypothetical protein
MNSTRRTLAIVGASILTLGFFLPVISFLGLINLSYFDLVRVSTRFATGLVVFALGGISLFFALKNNLKPLIATGILALAVLVYDFMTYKKAVAGLSPSGRMNPDTGGAAGQFGDFANELTGLAIQPAWGMFMMAIAAILLIVASAMKDKPPMNHTDWNRNPPPPPMNYS